MKNVFELDVDKLLRILVTTKRYKPPIHRSFFAAKVESGSRWVMFAAGVLYVALLILAGFVYFGASKSEGVKLAGSIVGLLSMLLVLVSLLMTTISSIVSLARAKADFYQDFLEQKSYDMDKSRVVLSVMEPARVYAKRALELKLARVEYRLSSFLGGSDKVALFSLAGMGWAAYKEIGQKGVLFGDIPTAISWIIVGGLAFLFGISLGALVLKNVSDQCRYALELIDLGELLHKLNK